MRIVFMGSPDFAVPSLRKLFDVGYEIEAVFTQPDKKKGRGKELAPTPVKSAALALGLEVYTPLSLKEKDVQDLLLRIAPDAIVVVAYGKILPPEVLNIPKYGCINVHASLLPRYRGAAPIHRAVINGETVTGVTTMFMDVGLDTGDMIYKLEIPITEEDTVGIVHDKLANAGADLIVKTLEDIRLGKAPRIKQNDAEASYAAILTKEDERIDWSKKACDVFNHIRGMNPYPGTFTLFRDLSLKIWCAKIEKIDHQKNPGTVLVADAKRGILVACGHDAIWLCELQPAGSKRMAGDAFVRGYKVSVGEIFS